ncbi:MFS transporter [Catenulispora yoronensis]|uniref:MFS transporter n=2 Tax=Catenulispora yoronensis TaxID=450799 RepID=A0ABP5GMJ4_9ACTN
MVGGAMARGGVLRWVAAYTCSVSGDSVYFVTLSWAASREVGAGAAGLVLAAGAVPRAVLMLGGGVVADRYGAWRVLIVSDLIRCLAVLAVALVHGARLAALVPLSVAFGVVDALFMPAVGALPPLLVPAERLAKVQGMRVLGVRIANLAGPVLAGAALGTVGVGGAFGLAAALFGASLVLLATLRIPRTAPTEFTVKPESDSVPEPAPESAPEPATLLDQFREGLHYVRAHARLRRLVIVVALSELCFSGPVAAAVVLLVAERHWSGGTVGWILGAFSVGGAATGSVMAARAERLRHVEVTIAGSLLLTSALLLTQGATPRAVAIGVAAVLGAATGVTMVLTNARVQTEADPRLLGRVTAVTTLGTLGLSPLIYPLVGVVAQRWGTETFFVGCAAVCLAAVMVLIGSVGSGTSLREPAQQP